MPSSNRRRGRPPTYNEEQRAALAELIRRYGGRGAHARSGVSRNTLLRIAKEFGIVLKKGRRRGTT